jgi:hypothetical protein
MTAKFFKSLMISSLVIPVLMFADGEEHHSTGARTDNTAQSIDLQSTDEASQPQISSCEQEGCCGFLFDKYPPVYYPSSTHWLIAVSAWGDSLELEDGSVWKISSYDGYKVLNWRSNDPLAITQNFRWFSKYNYRIVNQNTGSSLEVNLDLGPIKCGEYTRYIIAIDPSEKALMLSDNTHWEISYYDSSVFSGWAIGDAVIIGYNSGWDSACESILINVAMNNHLRAKQF